jgi:hypothetical protein
MSHPLRCRGTSPRGGNRGRAGSCCDRVVGRVAVDVMHLQRHDRLKLLDRIAERVPELDLDQQLVEWTTMDDGAEALVVNGGGFDGGDGAYFANCREEVHVVGVLAPLIDGHIRCVVIRPDGSRQLARVERDPLA